MITSIKNKLNKEKLIEGIVHWKWKLDLDFLHQKLEKFF